MRNTPENRPALRTLTAAELNRVTGGRPWPPVPIYPPRNRDNVPVDVGIFA